MERVVYQQMAELDDRHWWYRARRQIIADLIRREARLPDAAQILDIPVGTVMSRLHRGRRILKSAMADSAVGSES